MTTRNKAPKPSPQMLLDELYAQVQAGTIGLPQAVRTMRRISGMSQEAFAAHRGISVQSLRLIESGSGNPTVATLNKVAKVFGLQLGFVPVRPSIPL